MSTTAIVFDPSGTPRDIPQEQLQSAVKAGGTPGVRVQAPDGQVRIIPANRLQEAAQNGGKVLPLEQQEVQHEGFWSALGSDIKAMIPHSLSAIPLPDVARTGAQEFPAKDAARKQAGYSTAYRIAAPIGEAIGVNAPGMEQSASEGDVGGVAGHAAAIPAVLAATEVVKPVIGAAAKAAGPAAERLYQSALKPSTRLQPERVARIVQTGLQEGIPVSEAGVEKLGSLIDDVNDKIKQSVAGSTGSVNKFSVASRLGDTAQKFANQVNPTADLNAISESGNEFLNNQPGQIPVQDAQALKQGTYQQLKGKAYGELKSATIESQKALARGLKEELVKQIPELADLNARDSRLIDLDGVLNKAVQRISNHQIMGIGTPIAAGAAKAVTGSTAMAGVTGFVKALVDDPVVKSRLAIALNKASRGAVPIGQAMQRVNAYSAALAATSASRADQPSESQP